MFGFNPLPLQSVLHGILKFKVNKDWGDGGLPFLFYYNDSACSLRGSRKDIRVLSSPLPMTMGFPEVEIFLFLFLVYLLKAIVAVTLPYSD